MISEKKRKLENIVNVFLSFCLQYHFPLIKSKREKYRAEKIEKKLDFPIRIEYLYLNNECIFYISCFSSLENAKIC